MSPFHNGTKKNNINWDKEYLPIVQDQLKDFEQQGIKPTFRGMYYTLVDLGVLPKTEAKYGNLNKASVRWRENKLIPIDSFADHTRSIVKNFDDDYVSQEDYVYRGIRHLERAEKKYKIPLWFGQHDYVEIWLEKDAAVGTFESIVEGLEVIVVPNRGHSSVSFINDNIDRLKQKQSEGKNIHILYFGDEDPSGEAMDIVYKGKFADYGLYDVDLKRYAVTKDQKERFDLQTDPDPETLKKLQQDPNRFKFMVKYELFKISDDAQDEFIMIKGKPVSSSYTVKCLEGGRFLKHDPTKLFAVQLEAMQTPKVRAYLRALVLYLIDKWYNPEIYENMLKDHPEKTIRELALSEVKDLYKRLKLKDKRLKKEEKEKEKQEQEKNVD